MDVLFLAYSGNLSHYSFRPNVTFQNGGNVQNLGWNTAVQATITINGLPPEITSVSGNFSVLLDGGTEIQTANWSTGLTGGAAVASFPIAPTGERQISSVFLSRTSFETIRIFDSLASSATTQTIAAPQLPPLYQRGGNSSPVLVSPAAGAATWVPVTSATSVSDAQYVRLQWSHMISGSFHPHTWHIMLPPEASNIALPKLPTPLMDHYPAAQDSFSTPRIRQIEIPTVTGYDAARALPSRNLMCVECAVRANDFQRAIVSGNF
jgi:hypothetical protein